MKASVQAAVNTPVEDLERNILSSVERVPIYDGRKMAWGGTAAICGSGPSLPSMLGPVGWCDKNPKIAVFAIKGAHDFLIENEIIPDVMVMMDAKPDQVRYVKNPNPDVEYWMAWRWSYSPGKRAICWWRALNRCSINRSCSISWVHHSALFRM